MECCQENNSPISFVTSIGFFFLHFVNWKYHPGRILGYWFSIRYALAIGLLRHMHGHHSTFLTTPQPVFKSKVAIIWHSLALLNWLFIFANEIVQYIDQHFSQHVVRWWASRRMELYILPGLGSKPWYWRYWSMIKWISLIITWSINQFANKSCRQYWHLLFRCTSL